MNLKKTIATLFKKGIMIVYSTGKPYDVHYQERSDAMDDIRKQKEARDESKDKT